MDFSNKQTQIVGGIAVLVVIVLGIVMWQKSASTPAIPTGQTLANPLGVPEKVVAPGTQASTTAIAPR